jgi:hypothetical protein
MHYLIDRRPLSHMVLRRVSNFIFDISPVLILQQKSSGFGPCRIFRGRMLELSDDLCVVQRPIKLRKVV